MSFCIDMDAFRALERNLMPLAPPKYLKEYDLSNEPNPKEYLSTWMFPQKLDTSALQEASVLKPRQTALSNAEYDTLLESLRHDIRLELFDPLPPVTPSPLTPALLDFAHDLEDLEDRLRQGIGSLCSEDDEESLAVEETQGMTVSTCVDKSEVVRACEQRVPSPPPELDFLEAAFAAASETTSSSNNDSLFGDDSNSADSDFVPSVDSPPRRPSKRSSLKNPSPAPEASSSKPSAAIQRKNKRKAPAAFGESDHPRKARKRSKGETWCRVRLDDGTVCTHQAHTEWECYKHRDTHFPHRYQCPTCHTPFGRDSALKRHLEKARRCLTGIRSNNDLLPLRRPDWQVNPDLLAPLPPHAV